MKIQPLEFSKLIECWKMMPKGQGKAPQKTTFSPRSIASLMPFLFLIERLPGGELRVRLMGNELNANLTRTSSDGTVFDILIHNDWSFYRRFLKGCGDGICGGHLRRSIPMADGLLNNVEALHVPLADKNGDPRYMLGVMISRLRKGEGDITAFSIPASQILNYQYLDLGNGIPKTVKVLTLRPENRVDSLAVPLGIAHHLT